MIKKSYLGTTSTYNYAFIPKIKQKPCEEFKIPLKIKAKIP